MNLRFTATGKLILFYLGVMVTSGLSVESIPDCIIRAGLIFDLIMLSFRGEVFLVVRGDSFLGPERSIALCRREAHGEAVTLVPSLDRSSLMGLVSMLSAALRPKTSSSLSCFFLDSLVKLFIKCL